MRMRRRAVPHRDRLAGLAASALVAGWAGAALAAPEEIQVYLDDMDAKGELGLDVHLNYAFSGDAAPAYPGAQISDHRLRVTPEFSYGLTSNIELGAYLPLATVDQQGNASADGVKFRVKYIAPEPADKSWFWGANLEVGRVDHKLDINPWNAELKGIGGRRFGAWTLTVNANVDWSLRGPRPAPASLELDSRLTYKLHQGTEVGVENYNGLGEFRRLGDLGKNDQQVFLVIDQKIRKWDVEFGLGRGYAASPDGWVAKVILGVPLGR